MPISAESAYCLDAAAELLSYTADVPTGARWAGLDIDGIIDVMQGDRDKYARDLPGHYQWLNSLEDIIRETQRKWYLEIADDADRAMVNASLLTETQYQWQEIHWNLNDALVALKQKSEGLLPTTGLQHFRIPDEEKLIADLGITPDTDLADPELIRSLIEHHPRMGQYFDQLRDRFYESQEFFNTLGPNQTRECFAEIRYRMHLRREELIARSTETAREARDIIAELDRPIRSIKKPHELLPPKLIRQGKKALRRGVKLFQRMFGEEDIRGFLKGHEFIVEGRELNYRISPHPNVDLIAHSATGKSYHIPYRLEILNADNVVLAEGCVLFQDTPVIDQIIGLMMYVKTNQERTLLETTNFFNIREPFYTDPVITEVRQAKEEKYRQIRQEMGDSNPVGERYELGALSRVISDPLHDQAVAYRPNTTASVQEAISLQTGIPFYSVQSLVMSPIQLDQLIDGQEGTELLLLSN